MTKTLIDWSKPIETIDGYPVTYKGPVSGTDRFKVEIPSGTPTLTGEPRKTLAGGQEYSADGTHFYGHDQNIRNVPAVPAFDPTKPVETRDGRKARILCTDKKGAKKYPVVALIEDEDGDEDEATYTPEGHFFDDGSEDPRDLVNVAPKDERFFVLYVHPEAGDHNHLPVHEVSKGDWRLATEPGRLGLKVIFQDGSPVSAELTPAAT